MMNIIQKEETSEISSSIAKKIGWKRLRSRELFLTYKHVESLTKEKIKEALFTKLNNITWMIIGYETSDGDHAYKHYHVCIQLSSRCDIKSERHLDIQTEKENVHGQYDKVRDLGKTIIYTIKGGDYIVDGEINLFGLVVKNTKDEMKRAILSSIYFKTDIAQELESIRNRIAHKDITLPLAAVDLFTDYVKKEKQYKRLIGLTRVTIPYVPHYQYWVHNKVWNKLWDCIFNVNANHVTKKFFYIKDVSGTGKTTLMKHIFGRYGLLYRHKDILKSYIPGYHIALIFDDVTFLHLNREMCLNITDTETAYQADVKGSMVQLDAHVIRGMTSNKSPAETFTDYRIDPAQQRRVEYIDIPWIIPNKKLMYSTRNEIPEDLIEEYTLVNYEIAASHFKGRLNEFIQGNQLKLHG